MEPIDPSVLDNPAWHALHGPHRAFARTNGRAARYDPDVAPFAAVPDHPEPAAWAELAQLFDPGGLAVLAGATVEPPEAWETTFRIAGVQMVGTAVGPPGGARPEPSATRLGPQDVPEMLDLVARTQPGPFLPRTVELGGYLGVRRRGRLVAMAGHRMRLDGFTEISAVCTDVDARGQGLAGSLVHQLVREITADGAQPFLHATVENVQAIRLYESVGFTVRRTLQFVATRPGAA